jgi:hypothetical protein
MMRITVDRVEGDRAVLEFAGDDGAIETVAVPLSALPPGTQEGASLTFHAELTDTSEAEARLARLRKKTVQGPGTFDL